MKNESSKVKLVVSNVPGELKVGSTDASIKMPENSTVMFVYSINHGSHKKMDEVHIHSTTAEALVAHKIGKIVDSIN